MKDQFYNFIRGLQDKITKELEYIDGKAKFNEDLWERSEGGGGRSRIIENGNVIEKGGVNISAVDGPLPESMQKYFNVNKVDYRKKKPEYYNNVKSVDDYYKNRKPFFY